jgi:2-dehydro-3-deoxyphosphogluconate aldolase/(4S)-4-hydroxy-2-oxoglutarate aldolase
MPSPEPKQVLKKIRQSGIIPVFYHEDPEICTGVIQACYEGGLRVFEFTNGGPRAEEMYIMLKKQAQRLFPEMYLGAGAIMDAGAAQTYIRYNTDFIVCPVTDPETAAACRQAGVLWIPGCATPTEVSLAAKHSGKFIKLFPGDLISPLFLKSIRPYFPLLQFMPSDGIEPSATAIIPWLEAGASALSMGSKMITPEMLAIRDFSFLKERVKRLVKTIRQWRQQSIA